MPWGWLAVGLVLLTLAAIFGCSVVSEQRRLAGQFPAPMISEEH